MHLSCAVPVAIYIEFIDSLLNALPSIDGCSGSRELLWLFLACATSHFEFVGACLFHSRAFTTLGLNVCMHTVVRGSVSALNDYLLVCNTHIRSSSTGSCIAFGSLPRHALLPLLVCLKSVTDPCILLGESCVCSCGSWLLSCFCCGSVCPCSCSSHYVLGLCATSCSQSDCLLFPSRLPCHHCVWTVVLLVSLRDG